MNQHTFKNPHTGQDTSDTFPIDVSEEIALETELERRIAAEPDWQAGVDWGRPRHGHPEGTIRRHILAVLRNVDAFYAASRHRPALRLITLVHDTFKYAVDTTKARSGENHHGMRARRFAERLIDDGPTLDVIEKHDDAFNAWQKGARDKRWDAAKLRAAALLDALGPTLPLYIAFYRCDNATEGKSNDCFDWFVEQARRRNLTIED